MALPKSFVEELKFKNSIEDLIGRYVPLQRVGRNTKCRCPFHNETDASLVIYTNTQSFYCFGCGVGGDVISFVSQIENLEYMDTISLLADRAGMDIPKSDDTYDENRDAQKKVFLINKEAAKFYHKNLTSKEGIDALKYLRNRQFTDNIIVKFGVGYAKDSWEDLKNHLLEKGFSENELLQAGIVSKASSGRVYNQFRDRIIFPIFNIRGNVIGFGGRLLGEKGPKYLNSPDTVTFKKSKNLFSLNFAKDSKGKAEVRQLILTEGYMDVIALYQAGFTNAIATLGTALTMEQAFLISNYAGEVVLSYDSDIPGQKAVIKAIELFQRTSIQVKVLDLGTEKDPDDYVRNQGAKRFKFLIEKSLSSLDYLLLSARKKYDLNTSNGQSKYLWEATEILSQFSDVGQKDIYAGKIARELMIDKQTVLAQLRAKDRNRNKNVPSTFNAIAKANTSKNDNQNDEKTIPKALMTAEEDIIGYLYNDESLYDYLKDTIDFSEFLSYDNEFIYESLLISFVEFGNINIEYLKTKLSEKQFSKFIYIINKNQVKFNNKKSLMDCINRIKQENIKRSMVDLTNVDNKELEDYIKNLSSKKKGE